MRGIIAQPMHECYSIFTTVISPVLLLKTICCTVIDIMTSSSFKISDIPEAKSEEISAEAQVRWTF
ncbi:hypothetical protein [Pseudochryseolinea flava]|uniref:Uncharacterized protein n=1 Tax=Pseudochryseolinea flava TaxID=2059302 RepID=A0A364YAF3_9BACT|nr:hypothetical protein [Pseudochryseolinea flava]RAW02848.1 hypothetical protein DQQ10_01700 [Pseudochryseolinea flava]